MCYTGKCPHEGYMGDCTTNGKGCPPDGDDVVNEPHPPLQKWSQTCRGCGAVEKWEAKDFFDAADKSPKGWSYDQLLRGPVCPMCKA